MIGLAAAIAATIISATAAPLQNLNFPISACANLDALGIPKQMNLRAAAIMAACGRGGAGLPGAMPGAITSRATIRRGTSLGSEAFPNPGTNRDLITGGEAIPHVTQSEDQVWASGSTIVVAYNDSRDAAASNYSGISVSTDWGQTFNRLLPSPFNSGHGSNFGDPILVHNDKLATWFVGYLASGCGGQGLGLWTSADALTWAPGVCAHSGTDDDRESMWVDNDPASPFYGRMYISWNNFNISGGALFVMRSDNGTTWTSVQLTTSFIRDVQISVAPGGTVLVATMNEGAGGFAQRRNLIQRSTDGGVSFSSAISMGALFAAPGDSLCPSNTYFVRVNPIWRHMGWGDLATGSNNVVVYSYAVHGVGSDTGDIYVVRSPDNGVTWGAPVRVDGTAANNTQWMPSTAGGGSNFFVSWYDRRNTTDGSNYQRMGVQSVDGGLTWSAPELVSDTLIPQPTQPDPNVNACYAGDYMRDYSDGTWFYDAWTDGRVSISGVGNQQDVELQKVLRLTPVGGGPPILKSVK